MGFDAMFNFMSLFIPIMFLLVFTIIIVSIIRGIGEWHKNNRSPRLTVPATVVTKREQISRHMGNNAGNMTGVCDTYTTSTNYYATFQVESGDRIEFSVSGSEYGMLAEGDSGKLTFQGTRYLSFER